MLSDFIKFLILKKIENAGNAINAKNARNAKNAKNAETVQQRFQRLLLGFNKNNCRMNFFLIIKLGRYFLSF